MLHTIPTHLEIYEVQVTNVEGDFTVNAEVSQVNKPNLISPNQCYKDVIQKYSHLKGTHMNDNDEKMKLPMHVIIGASEYAPIKTKQNIRIGNRGEPVEEHTAFERTIISGRQKTTQHLMLLTRSKEEDYTELCQSDVDKQRDIQSCNQKNDKHQHQILARFNLKKSLSALALVS